MKWVKEGLTLYGSEQLNQLHGVTHGFTDRLGGVSQGVFASLNFGLQDKPECVQENYRRACKAFGISRLVMGHQQHTDAVRAVTEEDAGRGLCLESRFPDGVDGLVTNCRQLALGVLGADCPGVLLCDPVAGAIGAVHSGWRGTVANITGKALGEMCSRYGARPEQTWAVIGPCIHACHFETGLEVADVFAQRYGSFYPKMAVRKGEKAYLDLPAAIQYDLEQMGVPAAQIEVLPHCTMGVNELFFSHRKGDRGRIFGFILLNS